MKWPWVSRERLEDAERRLTAADTERLRLLDLLLEGSHVRYTRPVADVVESQQRQNRQDIYPEQPAAPDPNQGSAVAFGTPFDRLEKRFDKTFRGGAVPAQYKARMN